MEEQVIDMAGDPQSRYDRDEQLINDPTQDESVRQQARFRQAFWQARFKRHKRTDFIADSFVGLWVNLAINPANAGIFTGKRLVLKQIEKFFKQPLLLDAIRQAGELAEDCLLAELTDSAEIYFLACKTDSNYGSNMLGFMKLKGKEIANKTAQDTTKNILALLIHIGRPAYSDRMIQAAWNAWHQVFTDFPLILDDKVRELDADTSRQIMEMIIQT